MDVKGLRSSLDTAPKKKGFMAKMREKAEAMQNEEKEKSKDKKNKK